jgi:hypothetical protein
MSPNVPNPFDSASRILLRQAGVALLCWLLHVTAYQLRFMRWVDTRLTVPGQPERYCDTVAHVLRIDQEFYPWAIPVESQVTPDPKMFGRALVYEGLLWMQEKPSDQAGDRFDVLTVVVNLTGVGRCARRMLWLPGAETTLGPIEWNLQTLDASVVLEQIAAGKAPMALLAWISLMKKGNDPATIQRWLEIANREADPDRKADFALVEAFADLTGGAEAWRQALKEFNVIESPTVNRWKAQTSIQILVAILERKFSPIPEEVRAKIEATTALGVLQDWALIAATADSMDAFRRDAKI